jgi:hypothetical protein
VPPHAAHHRSSQGPPHRRRYQGLPLLRAVGREGLLRLTGAVLPVEAADLGPRDVVQQESSHEPTTVVVAAPVHARTPQALEPSPPRRRLIRA